MSKRNDVVTSHGTGFAFICVLMVSILAWSSAGRAATLPGEGTESHVGLFSVYTNGGISGPGESAFDGGEGFSDSAASVSPLLGISAAESSLSNGPVLAPATLKARTILSGNHEPFGPFGAIVGGTGSARAFSSERFQYIGDEPTTLAVFYTLTYTTEFSSGHFSDHLLAEAAAFKTTDYAYSPDFGSLVGEFGAMLMDSSSDDAHERFFADSSTGGPATETFSIHFDVEPGQEFYLFQKLQTSAHLGMDFADAFSTLNSEFSDPDLIIRSIPEPATTLLLAFGSLTMLARRRGR